MAVIGNACDGLDLKGMQIHYSGTNAQAQQANCGEQAHHNNPLTWP
jgi:hypothetical protein